MLFHKIYLQQNLRKRKTEMLLSIHPNIVLLFFVILTIFLVIALINSIAEKSHLGIIFFAVCTYFSASHLVYKYDRYSGRFGQPYEEEFVIHYFNDSIYCSGKYKVQINVDREFYNIPRNYRIDTTKIRTGNWYYYYSNGKFSNERFYDENGNILKSKYYRSNGVLKSDYSYKRKKNGTLLASYTFIYENGIISKEQKDEYIENEDDRSLIETNTDFHPNGVKESTSIYIDDVLTNTIKWDTTGKVVLKLKYLSGNIMIVDSL